MMTLFSVPWCCTSAPKGLCGGWRYLAFSVAGAGLGLLGLFMLQNFWTTDLFTAGGTLDPLLAAQNRELLLAVFLVMAWALAARRGCSRSTPGCPSPTR